MGFSDDVRIERMQKNLSTIRKAAGLTSDALGEEIGVSRQTIGNIENGRSKLTKTQYLAIRAVLNYIAADNQELAQVVRALVDEPGEGEEPLGDGEVKTTKSTMDDMSKITEILAGGTTTYAALTMIGKTVGGPSSIGGGLVAGAVLPAFAYALYKKLKS